jgi:uncharacterized protein
MEEVPCAMKIVIAGGTGQVGNILARHFHQNGHAVVVLSRSLRTTPWRVVQWDGYTLGRWVEELERVDVLINLAGRSVNCRYTRENRRAILDSRILSTQVLHRAIAAIEHPPAVWLNASTATIYRHALDRPMDEANGEFGGNEAGAPYTWNFSIEIAKAWEQTFFSTITPGTRQVALRSAMTFSPDRGGIFDVFLRPYWSREPGLSSPTAEPGVLGILRKAWGARIGLPIAGWMLELGTFLLRTESELVLKSRQVVPGRLLDAGFQFTYPTWPQAAQELVARWRRSVL